MSTLSEDKNEGFLFTKTYINLMDNTPAAYVIRVMLSLRAMLAAAAAVLLAAGSTSQPPAHPQCRPSEFRCLNGACVALDRFCDGLDDCGDKSDEPRFCSPASFCSGISCPKALEGTVSSTVHMLQLIMAGNHNIEQRT
ncbi:uncharacterized protein CBL_11229 [Carabus blaptoides fortunei]